MAALCTAKGGATGGPTWASICTATFGATAIGASAFSGPLRTAGRAVRSAAKDGCGRSKGRSSLGGARLYGEGPIIGRLVGVYCFVSHCAAGCPDDGCGAGGRRGWSVVGGARTGAVPLRDVGRLPCGGASTISGSFMFRDGFCATSCSAPS